MTSRSTSFAILLFAALSGCRESSLQRESPTKGAASAAPVPTTSAAALPLTMRIDPPAGSGSEAPNLFVSPQGVLLSWIESENNKHSLRWARFARDRWSDAATVVTSDDLLVNWADVPAIAEAGERIFVVFPEMRPGKQGYEAQWTISTDGGKTFRRQGVLHDDHSESDHGFVVFTPENDHAVRAFWLDGRATNQAAPAMRLYSALVGDSIKNEVLLDERTCDCCSLGVGHSDLGTVIAYRDRDEREVRDISVIHSEKQGFSKPRLVSEDGYRVAGCPVNGPAVAVDGSRVALAWYTYANEQPRVKITFSSDSAASFSAPHTIAETNEAVAPLGRVTLAWGDQGDVILGYVESERENGRIVLRRVHPEGFVSAPFVLTETRPERKSGFPKMVRLDDRLLVVWTDAVPPTHVRAMLVPLAAIPRQTSAGPPTKPAETFIVRAGDVFPAFEVQTLAGKVISSASLQGKPALVNLWASYCEPCRQELPNLRKLHEKYQKRGLQVVGIAMDESLTPEALGKLAKKRGIDYTMWRDPEDHAGKALGARVLPVTFLVDARGKVVLVRRGAVRDDDAELEQAIQKLF